MNQTSCSSTIRKVIEEDVKLAGGDQVTFSIDSATIHNIYYSVFTATCSGHTHFNQSDSAHNGTIVRNGRSYKLQDVRLLIYKQLTLFSNQLNYSIHCKHSTQLKQVNLQQCRWPELMCSDQQCQTHCHELFIIAELGLTWAVCVTGLS